MARAGDRIVVFGSFLTVGPALEWSASAQSTYSRDSRRRARLLYFAPWNDAVKERLVGAAVLMAAAIILIPEMLSGRTASHQRTGTGADRCARRSVVKTYTIDLNQAPVRIASRPRTVDNRAPPPEEIQRSRRHRARQRGAETPRTAVQAQRAVEERRQPSRDVETRRNVVHATARRRAQPAPMLRAQPSSNRRRPRDGCRAVHDPSLASSSSSPHIRRLGGAAGQLFEAGDGRAAVERVARQRARRVRHAGQIRRSDAVPGARRTDARTGRAAEAALTYVEGERSGAAVVAHP